MSDEIKNISNSLWKLSTQNNDLSAKPKANDLVMAWAIDKDSGEPRYILELDKNHRGASCSCLCVSCKLPLTAVNAAKAEYQQRPHFKHPKGAQRESCLVLAARFAIAQQLLEQGFIELPQRRVSSRIVGLSGKIYEAWEFTKPERVKITDTQFTDKATALFTLDDGRKVLVELTGGLSESYDTEGSHIPTISINLGDDLSMAGMSPSELRARLTLLWAGACWHSHWADKELLEKASNEAKLKAEYELDWLVDDGTIDGIGTLTSEQKSETLLHSEVKKILEQEKRINLPELVARVEREAPRKGGYFREKRWSSEEVILQEVRLEKRLGRVIPDVIATVNDPENLGQVYTLLIEVTVTNTITEERLQRIKSTNMPTLEIDIGRMGGLITRDELVKLVVDELVAKRWLHHPKAEAEAGRLSVEIDAEIHRLLERERLRDKSLEISPEIWSERFLAAVTSYCNLREARKPQEAVSFDEQQALELLEDASHALVLHGYPEVVDIQNNPSRLLRILERLLSIKTDRGVGYQLTTGWQVINTIHLDGENTRTWHTLFLIAIKQYKPTLNGEQANKVMKWRNEVITSIESQSSMYLRSTKYDALISLLFPEMGDAIRNGFGTQSTNKKTTDSYKHNSTSKPIAQNYKDTRKDDLWLKGRDLEAWKLKYPEAAESFFGS